MRYAIALLLVLAFAASIRAEDAAFAVARGKVKALLKDPDSARFEGLIRKHDAVCGWVNAKNSLGGYTGRTLFVYVISSSSAYILDPNAIDRDPISARAGLKAHEQNCT